VPSREDDEEGHDQPCIGDGAHVLVSYFHRFSAPLQGGGEQDWD
jgi:hypothetical protein